MAEETNNAPAAKGGIGHIVRVVGPVVDVEFAPSEMPAIYNALRIDADTPIGHIKLVMEVQMHLPGRFGSCSCNVVNRRLNARP